MKFPVPKTIFEAALPVILANWIFGMGVIQYPIGRPRPIISTLWSIANFLAYLGFVIMADFSALVEIGKSKLNMNNFRMVAYFFVVVIAVSICLAHARAKIVGHTFMKLNDINGRLEILGIHNDYEAVLMAHIIHLCITFSAIVTIMVIDFIYVGLQFPSEVSRLGFCMTYHYFLASAFVVDYSFSCTIRYFGNRFRRLNALFIELNSLGSSETTATCDQLDDDQFPYYSSLILEIHGNSYPSNEITKKQWLFYVIKETRKLHRGLCNTAMETNRAFGLQVLLSVTLSFGLIITMLYDTYTAYVISNSNGAFVATWIDVAISLIWIIFHVMKILLIVESCETTSCEAYRTGGLISRLLGTALCDEVIRDEVLQSSYFNECHVPKEFQYYSKGATDILCGFLCYLYLTINIFMLQLVQNPLNFTAIGLFSVNYSLVYGIIGTVTTYLAIMIQIKNIYEPETVNTISINSTMLTQTNGLD